MVQGEIENADKRPVRNSSFERDMLRNACADALIANERAWLGWVRTSLNIMTVSKL